MCEYMVSFFLEIEPLGHMVTHAYSLECLSQGYYCCDKSP